MTITKRMLSFALLSISAICFAAEDQAVAAARNAVRKAQMAAVRSQDMVVFSPKGPVKATVIVFTDIDCGYCRKLQYEMPQITALGIEMKYLAFPRAGVGSASYNKAVNVWCSSDRPRAMIQAKRGDSLLAKTCPNPVASHYRLGLQMGIPGTPALLLEDGTLIPGYLPPHELAKAAIAHKLS